VKTLTAFSQNCTWSTYAVYTRNPLNVLVVNVVYCVVGCRVRVLWRAGVDGQESGGGLRKDVTSGRLGLVLPCFDF